jgi:hypothetical protein
VSEPGDQGDNDSAVAALRRRLQVADQAIPVPADLHRRLHAPRPRAGRSLRAVLAAGAVTVVVTVAVLSLLAGSC